MQRFETRVFTKASDIDAFLNEDMQDATFGKYEKTVVGYMSHDDRIVVTVKIYDNRASDPGYVRKQEKKREEEKYKAESKD